MNIMYNSGIYKITNLINKKIYIGSAINFKSRKQNHFNKLKNNNHDNIYLQRAYNKYGKDNFKFEIIEFVELKENLIKREQFWIDYYSINNLYNICPTAGNSLGRKLSNETKNKIGKKSKNRKFSKECLLNKSINPKNRAKLGLIKNLFTSENISGKNNYASRRVICIETKEIFDTLKDAGIKYNRTSQAIGKNCLGKTSHCAGLHWKYLDEYKDNNNGDKLVNNIKKYFIDKLEEIKENY